MRACEKNVLEGREESADRYLLTNERKQVREKGDTEEDQEEEGGKEGERGKSE